MESKRIERVRNRLKREYEAQKSYQFMALRYGVSKGLLYNFIEYGDIPSRKDAQEKLGLVRDLEKKNARDRERRKNQRDELLRLRAQHKALYRQFYAHGRDKCNCGYCNSVREILTEG
jgi:hypothetical protein